MDKYRIEIQIASDVNERDGIGIEFYIDNKLIIEIFRDDTRKTREITVYDEKIPFEIMEYAMTEFKKEIPWDFIED